MGMGERNSGKGGGSQPQLYRKDLFQFNMHLQSQANHLAWSWGNKAGQECCPIEELGGTLLSCMEDGVEMLSLTP